VSSAKLLLFDIDGTLINTGGVGRAAFDQAFQNLFNVTIANNVAKQVPFAGRTDPQILSELLKALPIDPDHWEENRTRFLEDYFATLEDLLDPPPPEAGTIGQVETLLQQLAAREDITLGLLTGNFERGARIKLAPFDLNRWFATGGFGSDATDRPTIAKLAAERGMEHAGMRISPEKTIVIGDTVLDIGCAKANGFHSVGFGMSEAERNRLHEAGADLVIESYEPVESILSWIDSL
jgi:phosphoglycolate phosphatase-like HAD superfamily hydrolase